MTKFDTLCFTHHTQHSNYTDLFLFIVVDLTFIKVFFSSIIKDYYQLRSYYFINSFSAYKLTKTNL